MVRAFNRFRMVLRLTGLGVLLVLTVIGAQFMKKERMGIVGKAAGVEPYKKVFSSLMPAQGYLPWIDWYPVDFGQPKGYRMLNWWFPGNSNSNQKYQYGNSYFHVLNKPGTLPAYYNGNSVDYFYIWACLNGYSSSERCYTPRYKEIISQGTAVDPAGKTTLEHWARGTVIPESFNWEVYYNPTVFGVWGNCNKSYIQRYKTQGNLEMEGNKKPMTMRLPDRVNNYYISEPVCALVFNNYAQNPNNLKDNVGDWIVITITHERYYDNQYKEIVRAENIYLTDNLQDTLQFENGYCRNNNYSSDTLHCIGNAPNKTGLIVNKDGRDYKVYAYEEYWMRKTASSGYLVNPVTGQQVRDRFGFGAFRWYSWLPYTYTNWDQITNDGTRSIDNGAGNQVYKMEKCDTDIYNNIGNCY